MTRHSALYTGDIVHARRDVHAQRTFRYPVFVAVLDLDELPALDRELRLFSHRRRNLFSLDERDYAAGLHASGAFALRDAHRDLLAAHGLPAPATARLVTNLRVLGYTFNPVSFFLGYDSTGALTTVVAEVNNTYGGRHAYVLGPADRIPGASAVAFRTPRELFVSPFLHGRATYDFVFDAPLDGASLAITMHLRTGTLSTLTTLPNQPTADPREDPGQVLGTLSTLTTLPDKTDALGDGANNSGRAAASLASHSDDPDQSGDSGERPRPEATNPGTLRTRRRDESGESGERPRVFTARLRGERRPLSDRVLAGAALRYPLMTLQVIGLIHFEALKLHLRGAPYRRPGADHRPIVEPAEITTAPVTRPAK